jgi:hypothetical protein
LLDFEPQGSPGSSKWRHYRYDERMVKPTTSRDFNIARSVDVSSSADSVFKVDVFSLLQYDGTLYQEHMEGPLCGHFHLLDSSRWDIRMLHVIFIGQR